VGKTSSSFSTEGIEAKGDHLQVIRDGDVAFYLNRLTSDGDIARFYKNGSIVGSIGTTSGEITLGSNETGIRFTDAADRIDPWNISSNVARDAVIDLGAGVRRFKNLYLSGGVYLGGTGSANHLDDYEEGTWTPTVTSNTAPTSVTYDSQSGYYTKVGRLVTVQFDVDIATWSGGSSFVLIDGLPFATHINVAVGSLSIEGIDTDSLGTSSYVLRPRSTVNSQLVLIYDRNNTSSTTIQASDMSGNERFRGTISYITTA
jgi:hypothetical protein